MVPSFIFRGSDANTMRLYQRRNNIVYYLVSFPGTISSRQECACFWPATWDFQQCGMCDQQSLRSACAYAQSDQSLCSSLEYSMTVKLLTEHHLDILSLKGGCTGSFESTHFEYHIVGNHMPWLNYVHLLILSLLPTSRLYKWAATWEFQQCSMCDQQRLSSAFAYAQSDQSLFWSFAYSMTIKLLTEHHLEFPSLTGGC